MAFTKAKSVLELIFLRCSRYVSTAVVLVLTIVLYAVAWWGRSRLSRISHRGIVVLGHMTIFIVSELIQSP